MLLNLIVILCLNIQGNYHIFKDVLIYRGHAIVSDFDDLFIDEQEKILFVILLSDKP